MGYYHTNFIAIRQLIAEKGLSKRPYAEDSSGRDCDPLDPSAVAYSILGAIYCVEGRMLRETVLNLPQYGRILRRAMTSPECHHVWSRSQYTSVEEVLELLDRCVHYTGELAL